MIKTNRSSHSDIKITNFTALFLHKTIKSFTLKVTVKKYQPAPSSRVASSKKSDLFVFTFLPMDCSKQANQNYCHDMTGYCLKQIF